MDVNTLGGSTCIHTRTGLPAKLHAENMSVFEQRGLESPEHALEKERLQERVEKLAKGATGAETEGAWLDAST